MSSRASRQKRKPSAMERINVDAAGIDIGASSHFVAVPEDRDERPVREFAAYTADLYQLADWLKACGIKTVAMESTGVYWIPLYEILAARGLQVLLANARTVKHVPGRKTDVNDVQWLQQLHTYGLLRGSFHPPAEIAALRAYLRQRERLLDDAAQHVQHMQKALTPMNLKLQQVVSDITGQTGMQIIRAILAGTHDPRVLANFRDRRCRRSVEEIAHALEGHYRPEHLFALQQAVALYDTYQAQIAAGDQRIAAALAPLRAPEPPADPLPPPTGKTRQKNALAFDVRAALYGIVGVDLTQIHGLGTSLAFKRVAECGTDLSAWPTAKHFVSWLCLSPGNKISGGKLLSARTRRTSTRATALLRLAAVTVGKTDSARGAGYRRLAMRVGKAKAITATARKLAMLFYNTVRHGRDSRDPGASADENRHRERV